MQSVAMEKAVDAQDVLSEAVARMQDLGAEFSDARSQTVKVIGVSSLNGGCASWSRRAPAECASGHGTAGDGGTGRSRPSTAERC